MLRTFIVCASLTLAINLPANAGRVYTASFLVDCPEGLQTYPETFPWNFEAGLDLFADLYSDLPRITECEHSGFQSYRDFTYEERLRIADLMEGDEYAERVANNSPAKLALWIEEQITSTLDTRLKYRLRLFDTLYQGESKHDRPLESTDYRRLLAVVRAGHLAYAVDDIDLARLKLQIAFLAHKAGDQNAGRFFDEAVEFFEGLPAVADPEEGNLTPDERRKRYVDQGRIKWMTRNIHGIELCLSATGVLAEVLCEGALSNRHDVGHLQGIERLTRWVVIGSDQPYSKKEKESASRLLESLREGRENEEAQELRFEIEKRLGGDAAYFIEAGKARESVINAIRFERRNNPLFKRYFDEFFVLYFWKNTYRSGRLNYFCDLLKLTFDKPDCNIDESPSKRTARDLFPDLKEKFREQSRQSVLAFSAHKFHEGQTDHRAVIWALAQPDFDKAIAKYRIVNLNRLLHEIALSSASCDLGNPCKNEVTFKSWKHQFLKKNEFSKYREMYEEFRRKKFKATVRELAKCYALSDLGVGNVAVCDMEENSHPKLQELTVEFADIYKKTYLDMMRYKARQYGTWLARPENKRGESRSLGFERARLERLYPEAKTLIEATRVRVFRNTMRREGVGKWKR